MTGGEQMQCVDLGRIGYGEALELQTRLFHRSPQPMAFQLWLREIGAQRRTICITESDPGRAIWADVTGILKTNADGERYIEADMPTQAGTGTVDPVSLKNRSLGGGDWFYDPVTGAGQKGIAGGSGLNNIGLLIRIWGKVTQVGTDYLYLDDGSNLKDGTYTDTEENIGVRVICDPSGYVSGDHLEVTGISSSFEVAPGDIARRILTRRAGDVRQISGP